MPSDLPPVDLRAWFPPGGGPVPASYDGGKGSVLVHTRHPREHVMEVAGIHSHDPHHFHTESDVWRFVAHIGLAATAAYYQLPSTIAVLNGTTAVKRDKLIREQTGAMLSDLAEHLHLVGQDGAVGRAHCLELIETTRREYLKMDDRDHYWREKTLAQLDHYRALVVNAPKKTLHLIYDRVSEEA